MTTNRKPRRTFKESFKKQMVELHKSGKPRKDILREYDLTPSTFDKMQPMEALVTDLTYVKVGKKWHDVCFILNLFNLEIVGHSSGPNKSVDLVLQAIGTIEQPLDDVEIFHTDRGKKFDNQSIDELLDVFQIKRSLSRPGCPYDNAVAEATYRAFKIEFIYQQSFDSLFELQYELIDYVNWWNKFRKHGKLGYQSLINYRLDWELKQAI